MARHRRVLQKSSTTLLAHRITAYQATYSTRKAATTLLPRLVLGFSRYAEEGDEGYTRHPAGRNDGTRRRHCVDDGRADKDFSPPNLFSTSTRGHGLGSILAVSLWQGAAATSPSQGRRRRYVAVSSARHASQLPSASPQPSPSSPPSPTQHTFSPPSRCVLHGGNDQGFMSIASPRPEPLPGTKMSCSPPQSKFGGTGSNSFDLKTVVEAFFYTNADGRKSYVKGRTVVWTVDIDKFSIDALTHQLAVELNIGNNQLVSVCPGIITQPAHQPTTESVTSEVGSTSQPNVAQADQTQQPENPFNPFDNEEEYVGVDDEHLVGVSISEHIVEASSVAPEEEASNAAEDDMDPDDVKHLMQQEEEVADMDLHYNVADDPYNADIKVGALFPDMATFRKAIRHHAVVADFEMANVKTDSTRF
ncbi:hypothetical protein QYE76_009417 [Lolium multiflorum]|uniref:Transposase MuDR plant domain-containing protein n=1 Tax=Lolium multiflorum TaxID=4521 RepID=A0AAD8X216_LOLMU|nr:hypothetical protein QYE76_009417 [Lolium multiflorum]